MNSESQGLGRMNIFDDDVSDEEFKLSITKRHNIEGDSEEVVNLDGSTIVYQNTQKFVALDMPQKNPDVAKVKGHERSQSNVSDPWCMFDVNGSDTDSDRVVKAHLESTWNDEDDYSSRKNSTKEDVASLEGAIRKLRRDKLKSDSERWKPLRVNETIERITNAQPYTLELYTSKKDKLALIDRALLVHDGNAIVAITLFLKHTLSPRLFISEMKNRPRASKHYVCYLASRFAHQEMLDFYRDTGQKEEEAMLEYQLSVNESKDVDARIRNLQTCYRSHIQHTPSLSREAHLIQEHIALLERQRPIEAADAEAELSGKVAVFRTHPRKSGITNMSVITTLYYCSLYHYDKTENHLACPASIKKQHQLTEKEFFWPVLSARSRLKCWLDIEGLMTAKGWFGSTKLRAVIGFDKVANVLYKTGAPTVIVGKYLRLVDDSDQRLTLAKSYECHDIVVDTLVSMKNREELEAYKSRLTVSSPEYFYARDALNNSSTRWKPQ